MSRIQVSDVAGVPVASWNPVRPMWRGRRARLSPVLQRPDNFGDLIGPEVVRRLVPAGGRADSDGRRLFAVGSVLHFAADGDVVWGSGRNGKKADDAHRFRTLDVRAVRGPRTRGFLLSRGISVPEVYGDPALLLPRLFPETTEWTARRSGVIFVPNLNDRTRPSISGVRVVEPTAPLWDVVRAVAQSEFVVATSLHGVIVAEALGVPARLVSPSREADFKYLDYFEGTGRFGVESAETVEQALRLGPAEPLAWDAQPLVDAFPSDLWGATPAQPVR